MNIKQHPELIETGEAPCNFESRPLFIAVYKDEESRKKLILCAYSILKSLDLSEDAVQEAFEILFAKEIDVKRVALNPLGYAMTTVRACLKIICFKKRGNRCIFLS